MNVVYSLVRCCIFTVLVRSVELGAFLCSHVALELLDLEYMNAKTDVLFAPIANGYRWVFIKYKIQAFKKMIHIQS